MVKSFKVRVACAVLLALGTGLYWAVEVSKSGAAESGVRATASPAPPRDAGEALVPTILPVEPREPSAGDLALPPTPDQTRIDVSNPGQQATGWVVGRVLCADSARAVPFMKLRVEGQSTEDVTTDAEGRFRTENRFAAGSVEIWFVDHEPLPKSPWADHFRTLPIAPRSFLDHDWDPSGAELEFHARAGPTWKLELLPTPDLPTRELLVRLRTLPTHRASVAITLSDGRQVHTGGAGVNWSVTTRMRKGADGTWARFPALHPLISGSGPSWLLSVESRDGSWYGEAQVNSVANASPMELAVEVMPLGALALRVTDPDGYPEAGILVSLIRVGTVGEQPQRTSWRSKKDGRHTFDMLTPGEYRLTATSFRHVPIEKTLFLGDRERLELELVCHRKPIGGSIIGTLVSATGSLAPYSRAASIAVRRVGEERVLQRIDPQWEQVGDEWEYWFYLGNMPLDEYELTVIDRKGNYPWHPSSIRLIPPAEDLLFVRQDDLPTIELEFHARDESGQPLQAYLSHRINGGSEQLAATSEDEPSILRFAEGSRLAWTLWADGYIPARGDLGAFGETFGPMEERKRAAKIVLHKGWGARIRIVSDIPGDRRPLAGAVIYLDGVAHGATDAQGLLDATLATAPERIEAHKSGWTQRGGSVSQRSANLEVPMIPVR